MLIYILAKWSPISTVCFHQYILRIEKIKSPFFRERIDPVPFTFYNIEVKGFSFRQKNFYPCFVEWSLKEHCCPWGKLYCRSYIVHRPALCIRPWLFFSCYGIAGNGCLEIAFVDQVSLQIFEYSLEGSTWLSSTGGSPYFFLIFPEKDFGFDS